jgi:hypothetical protein
MVDKEQGTFPTRGGKKDTPAVGGRASGTLTHLTRPTAISTSKDINLLVDRSLGHSPLSLLYIQDDGV